VIVRIFNDRQYRLDEHHYEPLNVIDDAVVAAVDAGDEQQYRAKFDELLAFVREHGVPVGDDDLIGSDVLLPPDDFSFAEAGQEFTGDGLVPDPADA